MRKYILYLLAIHLAARSKSVPYSDKTTHDFYNASL